MVVILFSSKNVASANIAKRLIAKGFEKVDENTWQYRSLTCQNFGGGYKRIEYLINLLDTGVESILDIPTDFDTDYLIVLSTHKSKQGKPILTAHFPGNWNEAELGGKSRTLNIAYWVKLATLINEINNQAKAKSLDSEFQVVLEVDHHGPTCDVPIIFVEIGSTENEWKNKTAGEAIANAVFNVVTNTETSDSKPKTVFGVGGGHYAKEFTKAILHSNFYVGHILPKYNIDTLAEDTFKQALERNVEKIEEVLVLKESLNLNQKKKIKELCDRFGVRYTEYEVD